MLARQVVGNDANHGSGGYPVTEYRHIGGTHSNTAKTCGATEELFLGSSMDVDATIKRVSVAQLLTIKPENAGDDRIASGGIWLQDFTGRHS